MKKNILIICAFFLLQCSTPTPLSEKADCTVTGTVYPGIASGQKGTTWVTISKTNVLEKIDWQSHTDELPSFGTFKIEELVSGKYFIICHLDSNRDGVQDRDEFWGGYDANGDGRLDAVSLIGGETTKVNITYFDRFD